MRQGLHTIMGLNKQLSSPNSVFALLLVLVHNFQVLRVFFWTESPPAKKIGYKKY